MPNWAMHHAGWWKPQISHFAGRMNVIAFDGRGNGRSDRPKDQMDYRSICYVEDAVAVLDACGVDRTVVVGWSAGAHHAAMLAALHPERVSKLVMLSPFIPFGDVHPNLRATRFTNRYDSPQGLERYNLEFWCRSYPEFVSFYLDRIFPKGAPDHLKDWAAGIALETDGLTLATAGLARRLHTDDGANNYRKIDCPTLIIHGQDDPIVPPDTAELVQFLTGAKLYLLKNVGHVPSVARADFINRKVGFFSQYSDAEARRYIEGRPIYQLLENQG